MKTETMKNETPLADLEPGPEVQMIPRTRLQMDPHNIRRTYDPDALAALAESIRRHGILQNLEANPAGVCHFGNRRLAAIERVIVPEALAASGGPDVETLRKLEFLPVRVLSWEESKGAKIRQIVENLQREGVSAYDEAVGYAALLDERDDGGGVVWTPETIAERIGKESAYVRQRLKLRHAPPELLAALEAGTIGTRICEHVGRIPSPAARVEAARRVLRPVRLDRPLTEDETVEMIAEFFMVRLANPPFDPADGALLPGAPACAACPHLSANDPDLVGQLAVRGRGVGKVGFAPDLCTSPECYRKKVDAVWRVITAEAEARGYVCLDPLEAAAVWDESGELPPKSPYLDLDKKPTPKDGAHYDEKRVRKWRTIFETARLDLRLIKARHPVTNKIHDLVERRSVELAFEAAAAMRDAEMVAKRRAAEAAKSPDLFPAADPSGGQGFEAAPAAPSRYELEELEREKKAAERREAKAARAVVLRLFDALAAAMAPPPSPEVAAWVAAGMDPMVERYGETLAISRAVQLATLQTVLNGAADACALFAEWLDLEKPGPGAGGRDFLPLILAAVEARVPEYGPRDLAALVALAAVAAGSRYHGPADLELRRLCVAAGVDAVAVEKKTRRELEKRDKKPGPVRMSRGAAAASLFPPGLVEPAPVEPAPVDPAPVDPAPVDPAPDRRTDPRVLAAAAEYDAALAAGGAPILAAVEARFGLKRDQLRTFRKNRNRLAKQKAEREGGK